MAQWVDPGGRAWTEADRRLATANVSASQVQVAWIKLANVLPTGELADHGKKLYDDTSWCCTTRERFPIFDRLPGSRIYAGYRPPSESRTYASKARSSLLAHQDKSRALFH
jgi:hypothetical protein